MLEQLHTWMATTLSWSAANPEQVTAGIFSALAIYLVAGEGGRWMKWGCLAGFIAQPFWFGMGISHGVYVMAAMSAFYGFSYAKGLWREWLKPRLMRAADGRRG